jgi:hypothetical protein
VSTNIAEAITSLNETLRFKISEDDEIHWVVGTDETNTAMYGVPDYAIPTQAEIDAEVIRLQAEYDSQEYARNRARAYPSLQDQADMQYHDAVDGTTTWQDAIAAIKAEHPKA